MVLEMFLRFNEIAINQWVDQAFIKKWFISTYDTFKKTIPVFIGFLKEEITATRVSKEGFQFYQSLFMGLQKAIADTSFIELQ
jgi:hypothetical protein